MRFLYYWKDVISIVEACLAASVQKPIHQGYGSSHILLLLLLLQAVECVLRLLVEKGPELLRWARITQQTSRPWKSKTT